MVWVILTLSKIEALLAFSRAHFGHDYHKMLKIVIPNAGSTCCPIHLKQAERPSHIDKQGNADTTADTGAKLKKNFISEVTIYRGMRPMIMKALKSKIYQAGC